MVATLQGGRPRISTFSREELLAWQKRAWDLGKQERWLGFEELLAATYLRPTLEPLQGECVMWDDGDDGEPLNVSPSI